jgi:hypothetical protein
VPPGADPEEVHVTYTMTSSDLLAGGVAASRQSVMINTIGAFAVVAALLSFVVTRVAGLFDFFVPMVFGVAFLSGYAAGSLSALGASRRPDLVRAPIEFRATRDGVAMTNSKGRSEARWSMYKRVVETRSVVVFDFGTGAASMVPSRAFTPEERRLIRRWADSAGVLDPSPAWRSMALGVALGIVGVFVVTGLTYGVARLALRG